MKILKFGGTSVATAERLAHVADIIIDSQKKDHIAVVVSAFGGVTDQLLEISRLAARGDVRNKELLKELHKRHTEVVETLFTGSTKKEVAEYVKHRFNELGDVAHGVFLVKECSPRVVDFMMSFGERLSAYILAALLRQKKVDAAFLDAREVVKTDDNFGYAHVDLEKTYANIQTYFKTRKNLQIITGFLGSTDNDETTTIGRDGSDYTAALFGAALSVAMVEIWTDVDGIMTADPRKVNGAQVIQHVGYDEAAELSHFGAKVIHGPAIKPTLRKNIPIVIKNTMNPKALGTSINTEERLQELPITGFTSIKDICLLQIQGLNMYEGSDVAARFFRALAQRNINVVLISQASSEYSLCVAVPCSVRDKAVRAIEKEFAYEMRMHQVDPVSFENECSVIAVVGGNMRRQPGMAGKVFGALGDRGVNVMAVAQGSSELNISIVIKQADETKALSAIHERFFG